MGVQHQTETVVFILSCILDGNGDNLIMLYAFWHVSFCTFCRKSSVVLFEKYCLLGNNTMWAVESKPTFRRNKSQRSSCLLLSRCILAPLILRPCRWRRYVHPRRRLTFSGLHALISQMIILFVTTVVRTSNPIIISIILMFSQLWWWRKAYYTLCCHVIYFGRSSPLAKYLPLEPRRSYKLLSASSGNELLEKKYCSM
jgi:hypothetical protein